ncbi:MAG: hypothetical protein ACUVWP_06700 [bacterium]
MAKPYKYAPLVCTILSIIAVIGIVVGLLILNPLIIIFLLLPTVVYEVWRTQGESTRWASWILLIVLIAEIIFIIAGVSFDLTSYLGAEEKYVAGYRVPLGDIKVIGPIIMAILAIILITRTRGRYTKWLAVVIIISAFAIVYTLDATIFSRMFGVAVEEGLERIE